MPPIELEHKREDRCVAKIEAMGGQALKLVILGLMGWPDRTILLPGRIVFFVEFKRERVGIVSAQQKHWRRILLGLGFSIYIIDTDEDFDNALAAEISAPQIPGSIGRDAVQSRQRARTTTRRRG